MFLPFNFFGQIRIVQNGNIGIANTNPQEKLHVNDFILLGPKTATPTIMILSSKQMP